MALSPLDHLIDTATGVVTLVLVPFHLDRLYGPLDRQAPTTDVQLPTDAPFPLLPNAEPKTLNLKGGMTPEDIGPDCGFEPNSSLGRTSWYRWAAYAYTPYGWSLYPTPFFRNGRLESFQLGCPRDDDAGYDLVHRFLVQELDSEGQSRLGSKGMWPFRVPRDAARRSTVWSYGWGRVLLTYEPRDWTPLLSVQWKEHSK